MYAEGERRDTRATIAAADEDFGPFQLTANGDVRVRDDDANTAIGATDAALVDAGAVGSVSAKLRRLTTDVALLISAIGSGLTFVTAAVDLAMNGTRDILAAPGANKQIWVYGIFGTTGADGTIKFLDDTPTDISGTMPILAKGGFVLPLSPNANMPWMKCSTNKKLQAVLSAASDFDGIVAYAVIDV